MTAPRPMSDRAINHRTIFAVVDITGKIDANYIYMAEHLAQALDLAALLQKEHNKQYYAIPIILK